MLSFLPEDLERYVAKHATSEKDIYQRLAEATHAKTALPQMMVGNTEGLLLRSLVRIMGAKRVLEVGTFTGYSALSMAEGLPDDGVVITCDIDENTTAIAREHWARSKHGKKIRLKR